MGRLRIEKLEGGTFCFRSRFDEAINWAASACTAQDIAMDYGKNINKIVFFTGQTPISFNVRWPTRKDLSIAKNLAGIEVAIEETEDGEKKTQWKTDDGREELGQEFIAMELATEVARVCLETVSDWDEWPADSGKMEIGKTHEYGPAKVPVIRVGVVPEPVLEDIGLYLIAGSQPSEAEKKPSGSPPFGN